jgi:hypothetical protein
MHLASRCAPQIPNPDYRWDRTESAQAGEQRQDSLHPETRQMADHFYSTASPVAWASYFSLVFIYFFRFFLAEVTPAT